MATTVYTLHSQVAHHTHLVSQMRMQQHAHGRQLTGGEPSSQLDPLTIAAHAFMMPTGNEPAFSRGCKSKTAP